MRTQTAVSPPIAGDTPAKMRGRESIGRDRPPVERESERAAGGSPPAGVAADSPAGCEFEERKRSVVATLKICLQFVSAIVLRLYVGLYHRLRIDGCEHIPAGRSFVLVANHTSHVDLFCLLAALPVTQRHRAFPTIAQDYFCRWGIWMVLVKWTINALPFHRQAKFDESLADCERLLSSPGNVLLFFPEGTRSATGELGRFRPGVAYLTAGRDIPVVPCHISGGHAAWPKGKWFPRPTAVRLVIGEPRDYAKLPRTKVGREELCHDLYQAVSLLGCSTRLR